MSAIEWSWSHLVDKDPAELIAMAVNRAESLGLTLSPNDFRNVVNMLRHDYSDYDDVVRNTLSANIYGKVLDAIAEDFPWLAPQCELDKATHAERVPDWVWARRWAHEDGVKKQRAARAVIKNLSVGDKVTVKWRGPRDAEIVEIRRTRIKASFRLSDGTIRVIDRSADEVTIGDRPLEPSS